MQRLIPLVVTLAVLGAACGSDGSDDATPTVVIEGASAAPVADDTTDTDTSDIERADATDGDGADGNAASGSDDAEAQALAFAQCMRDEGLDFPDPTVASDGSIQLIDPNDPPSIDANAPETEAALDVCGDLIDGASFLPDDDDTAELEDQLLAFAECLRDQGVDVDDPNLSGGMDPGAIQNMFGDFDPRAPENADVVAACQGSFTGALRGGR